MQNEPPFAERLTRQDCIDSIATLLKRPSPEPPIDCRTCGIRKFCAAAYQPNPCPVLDKWLDDTYRDHYSVDTPEEQRWPTPDKEYLDMVSRREDEFRLTARRIDGNMPRVIDTEDVDIFCLGEK